MGVGSALGDRGVAHAHSTTSKPSMPGATSASPRRSRLSATDGARTAAGRWKTATRARRASTWNVSARLAAGTPPVTAGAEVVGREPRRGNGVSIQVLCTHSDRTSWVGPILRSTLEIVMFLRVMIVFLAAASAHGAGAKLVSSFHLDLDDCDDLAVSSGYLYFACHSTHEPGKPPANPASMDGWVAKLERRTGKLVYLTKLGGEGYDTAVRIKVDNRGHVYTVGFTGSQDFPTTPGALQRVYGGGESDAVLVEIGPDGQILYSTFVGGNQADQGNAIALLPRRSILFGGRTWSADFPGAKQRLGPRGKSDVFLARIRPADSRDLQLGDPGW